MTPTPKTEAPKPRTTIAVLLVIEGDPQEAYDAVDAVLDGGCLQDAVNEVGDEAGRPLVHVKSAVARPFDKLAAAITYVTETDNSGDALLGCCDLADAFEPFRNLAPPEES